MLRRIKQGIAVALTAATALYGLDFGYARMRSDAFAEYPVDRMYEMTNRWGGVEFSVGRSGYERCVKSLFPHFGNVPCWYLRTQEVRYFKVG